MSSSPKGKKTKKAGAKAKVVEEVEKAEKAVKKELKKIEKADEAPKHQKVKEPSPAGKAPTAAVYSRHGSLMISREGRGFSVGEISGAGLAPGRVSEWGARVDYRRRSVIDSNVSALRSWSPSRAAEKAEPEKAAAKIEHAGAAAVEEAEKAMKRAIKKPEKAAKKSAKKPRAKP
ncbi:MAG: hypothetical protein JRN29_05820 [Nitrososphaerota archaeon]|nr:hypothetical protein [Nitrososphaerota archaeon]